MRGALPRNEVTKSWIYDNSASFAHKIELIYRFSRKIKLETGRPPMNTPAKANWFLTHWRGEASLGISYWLNGMLLGYLLPALVAIGYSLLNPLRHHFRADAIVVLILTALQLGLWVWVVVGITRSANRHTARGGRLLWANVARVLMCVSVIGMAIRLETRLIPETRELASLAAGRDPLDTVTVETSPDGRTINLDGTIGLGSAEKLRQIMDVSPTASTLMLNSDGGREMEAEEMALLVQRKHLNTAVQDQCLSSCTIVFMAGNKREVDEGANLGFHQVTADGLTANAKRIMLQKMVEYYRSLGLREWFIDRIIATPPESMWYPTEDELKQAGVLN
jgi:hypothetical protein